jgi:hypothetical protein
LGCDSLITWDVTIPVVEVGVTQNGTKLTAISVVGSYQWLDCNSNFSMVSGETNRVFTPKENGKYGVEVTENGCKDTSVCQNVMGVATAHFDKDAPKIFPIPSDGDVFIDLGGWQFGHLQQVEIFNLMGSKVFEMELNPNAELNLIQLPKERLSTLTAGAYKIRLTGSNAGWTGSLILQ